jgi:hypothetical protein
MAHEEVRRGAARLLAEGVVADDRRAARRGADRGAAAELVLELGVVVQRVIDEVVLDEGIGDTELNANDERSGSARD